MKQEEETVLVVVVVVVIMHAPFIYIKKEAFKNCKTAKTLVFCDRGYCGSFCIDACLYGGNPT